MTSHWNSSDNTELFKKYVGDTYSSLDAAREAKKSEADYIISYLNLNSTMNVIDLGSGMGFIASHLANKVNHLYCVDVSETFLESSKETLKGYSNVSYHLINHGDLTKFSNIDAIYCVAVFIHFNIYDVSIYLEEIFNTLSPAGKALIDFYDADFLSPADSVFQRHKDRYKHDRNNLITNVNFNSKQAVLNICKHVGFEVEIKRGGKQPLLLLSKV